MYVNCLYQSWAVLIFGDDQSADGLNSYEKLLHMAMSALGLLVCAVVIGATTANVARHFEEADRFTLETSKITHWLENLNPSVDHHKRAGPAHWTPGPGDGGGEDSSGGSAASLVLSQDEFKNLRKRISKYREPMLYLV